MDSTILDSPSRGKSNSKIPALAGNFRRSASVRVRGEKANYDSSVPCTPFPSIAEKEEICDKKFWSRNRLTLGLKCRSQASGLNRNPEEDLESVDSFVSNISGLTTASTCEHAYFGKNGTTFSGRTHKFIVHCPTQTNTPEEYLTPTQRANKSIKRLKTLLQLAREKLREKEEEIFKLTKEVVELKVFKASLSTHSSNVSSPSEAKEAIEGVNEKSPTMCDAGIQALSSPDNRQNVRDFGCDACNDMSPIKASFFYEDKDDDFVKMSPTSPMHGYLEKMSATPDFLLSSLADSGNYDDLASSVSLHSKDSLGFTITPDLRPLTEEKQGTDCKDGATTSQENEQEVLVNFYESKLKEKKLEYEEELKKVLQEQEEKNINLITDFDNKLKEEELKFEDRWQNLLKTSEEEKKSIVDRFEEKLEEEKRKYFDSLSLLKTNGGKVTDMIFGESYVKKMEEEKAIYETSLEDIKYKFENEKLIIEKHFDDAMKVERQKFEESVDDIKRASDAQIDGLMTKIIELEARCTDITHKFEETLRKNSELEKENENLKGALQEQEERNKTMYLDMYRKGQEAARLQHADKVAEIAEKVPNKGPLPELLVQLEITESKLENLQDKEYRTTHTEPQGVCLLSSKEAMSLWIFAARKAMYKRLAEVQTRPAPKERCENDPEATLQFLKSAVYYFLTDRDNYLNHLRAIESILEFSAVEKNNIEKCYVHPN